MSRKTLIDCQEPNQAGRRVQPSFECDSDFADAVHGLHCAGFLEKHVVEHQTVVRNTLCRWR